MTTENQNTQELKQKIYERRLDFYWQFIAVYSVALLIYVIMKGTIIENTISFSFYDPVVLLLSLFIIATAISLLYQFYKKRSIILDIDFITLKTRFREKKYTLDMIRRITLSKDRRIRVKRPVRVIKIRLQNRRMPVRIRPSAFWNDSSLVQELMKIKKNIKEHKIKTKN
ncbi:hypothetical protein ACFLSQ_03445 [Bacteroidota bacterium]